MGSASSLSCRRTPGRTGRPRPHLLSALVGIGLVLLGCDRAPRDPAGKGARAIRADNVMAYGRYLADDARAGRHHASPEADSVVSDLLARLDAIGIAHAPRAQALRGPRAAAFVHHFTVPLQRLGGATRFALTDGQTSRDAQPGGDFRPLVFSTAADVAAPPVHLGRRAEDLPASAGALVHGRIIFVPPGGVAPRVGEPADAAYYRAARRLSECGAAAVVFTDVVDWRVLPGACYPSELPPDLDSGARSPRGVRLNLNPSRLGAALQAAAWRVAPERTVPALVLRPGWLVPGAAMTEATVCVQFDNEVSLGQNVLVGFGGGGDDDCIMLVAHYDHSGVNSSGDVLNGADDNASGVAALLEVARAFARVHTTLRRSVLLAFVSAEMQGGQGLAALLQDLPLLLGPLRPRVCFVLDAVGGNGRDLVAVHGGDADADLLRLLQRHNHHGVLLGPPLVLVPRPHAMAREALPVAAAAWPHASTAALLHSAGVPSLLINDGLDPLLYGQPEDDWEGVDAEKVARVARLLFAAAHEWATQRRATATAAAPR